MTPIVRPRLLDLFCGAGGAAKGYHDAGWDVTGVDIAPQPNYPYEFRQEDALDFVRQMLRAWSRPYDEGPTPKLLSRFDAIHASPPCQRWSSKTKGREKHPDLITPLRPLLGLTGRPYVIENVAGAPLHEPVQLCGSAFGTRVRRHRLFEANWPLQGVACDHDWQDDDKRFLIYDHGKWFKSGVVHVFGTGGGKSRDWWPYAMGVGETWDECWMTPAELAESIPPVYTAHIGAQLATHLVSVVAE